MRLVQSASAWSLALQGQSWALDNIFFLTLSLPWCHLTTTNKSRKLKSLRLFVFFALACEQIFIKIHTIEIIFVIWPENVLFQPGNLTGWGMKGLKLLLVLLDIYRSQTKGCRRSFTPSQRVWSACDLNKTSRTRGPRARELCESGGGRRGLLVPMAMSVWSL